MAKNKKPKQAPKLSPENYIRQKARNLALYECLINSDWKASGTANIVISRIHTNGNYTVGGYMVDLLCLGVIDSYYSFNTDEDSYQELIENMNKEFKTEKISYTLAHNIIYASIAYAEDLGFKPEKSFTNITQYILDEDTEAIEFMEIECGKEGKPVYIVSEGESAVTMKQVAAQLEKAVGKGNFTIIYADDEEDNFYDEPSYKM